MAQSKWKDRYDQLIEAMRKQKLKVTPSRQSILSQIVRAETPVSAELIYKKLQTKDGCDLATVYRTLGLFESIGVIRKTDLSGDTALYEIACEVHDHHHHIVCRQCKHIEAVDICLVTEQVEQIKKLGYQDVSHRLEFSGVCARCAGV